MKTPIILGLVVLIVGGLFLFAQNSTLPEPEGPSANLGDSATQNVLDLSGQGLTKTPAYVFDRRGLEELNLSGNALDGALQAEIRHLQQLKVLDLSDNKFTGVPAEIGQLKNLEVLDLSNNMLTGLPYELGNLSKLKLLDISGNDYSEADLTVIRSKLPSTTNIKTN